MWFTSLVHLCATHCMCCAAANEATQTIQVHDDGRTYLYQSYFDAFQNVKVMKRPECQRQFTHSKAKRVVHQLLLYTRTLRS